MASLKDIRTRINSVKSTQKITNAMKLVSAAKFSRANHAVRHSRPYRERLSVMVKRLTRSVGENTSSSYLKGSEKGKLLVVVVSTDRGLCGPLNTNVFKKFSQFVSEAKANGEEIEVIAWGRKAISYLKKEPYRIIEEKERTLDRPSVAKGNELAERLVEIYLDKNNSYKSIQIIYPKFRSVLEQTPTVLKLLPVSLEDGENGDQEEEQEYLTEPSLDEILDDLLNRQMKTELFQILLEGAASEHGARMTAMDAATNNAKEVIRKLTLQYNRARQAAITTELTEIISGAEALH